MAADFASNFRGADAELVAEIQANRDKLIEGRILVIDPSSLSAGFCFIEKMEIKENGVIKLPQKLPIAARLRHLVDELQQRWPQVDALGIEKIRGSRAHIYLLWSAGAAVAGTGAPMVFEIATSAWNKMRDKWYTKTDANDAKMMALFILGCLGGLDGKDSNEKEDS
jgi:hypothetical protein